MQGERERADQGLLTERLEPRRELLDGAVLDQHSGEAPESDQHREGHDQGREADDGDPEPVERAAEDPDEEARRYRRRHGNPLLDQPAERAGGKAHHRRHGEVDLRVQDDEGHDEGDDDLLDREGEEVDLVLGGEEGRGGEGVRRDDAKEQHREESFPAPHPRPERGGKPRGGRRPRPARPHRIGGIRGVGGARPAFVLVFELACVQLVRLPQSRPRLTGPAFAA